MLFVAASACACACQARSGAAANSAEAAPAAIEAVADPADQELVFARIGAERQSRERGELRIVNAEPPIQAAIRGIRAGSMPLDTLRTAMERFAESDSTEVQGWSVASNDLQHAPVPSAFLELDEATVAIVVIRYQASGGARYTVFYLLIHDGDAPHSREGFSRSRRRPFG